MKRILISSILCLAALPSHAALVAAYSFDETSGTTADDSIRNGTNTSATLSGGATFSAGKIGNALTLNGTNGYAWANDPVLAGATNLSVSVWVYANSAPLWGDIINNWGGGAFLLGFSNTSGSIGSYLNTSVSGAAIDPTVLSLNAWHQVAFTYDGTAGLHKLYIDGALVQTVNSGVPATLNSDGTIMGIGAKLAGGGATTPAADATVGYWNGKIDDLAFYDNALTQSDITTSYNNGLAGVSAVPEPSTYGLIGAGSLALAAFVRRRKHTASVA